MAPPDDLPFAARGIHPVLYAFFRPDGALDRAAMARQVATCVAQGADGVAVLGLATEVNKLSAMERRQVVEWAADDVAGRLPLAVTIVGPSPAAQVEAVRHAAAQGAAWVVLQPPRDPGATEAELIRFFGTVMDASPLPVAIQNAPEYLGVGLTNAGVLALARRHANFRLLKAEGPATLIERTVAETEGRLAVFNGRGGLELPDNLRAGCAGLIPAPECLDAHVAIHAAMARGDEAEAERRYAEVLPVLAFVMQGLDHLVCYGKRTLARRLGIDPVTDRAPALSPTAFGLAAVRRFADRLPPL